MSNSNSDSGGGISFFGLLTVLFIGLKLTGHITWPWIWVLSPLWLPLVCVIGFVVVGLTGVFLFVLLAELVKRFTSKPSR